MLKEMVDSLDPQIANPLEDAIFLRSFYKIWLRLLISYTKLHLTFPSDTLVAISCVITLLSSKSNLTNLHGHWTELLPLELLWSNANAASCTKDPLIPTWSWAGVRGMKWGIENASVEALLSRYNLRRLTSVSLFSSSNETTSKETTSNHCLQLSGPPLHDALLPDVPLGLSVPYEPRATKFTNDPGWMLRSPIKESQTPVKVQLDVEIEEKMGVVRIVLAQ